MLLDAAREMIASYRDEGREPRSAAGTLRRRQSTSPLEVSSAGTEPTYRDQVRDQIAQSASRSATSKLRADPSRRMRRSPTFKERGGYLSGKFLALA